MRTCIGCRRTAAKDELVRVVAGPGGSLALGPNLPGRGAWLCAGSRGCVEMAVRRKAFGRALRAEIAPEATQVLQTSLSTRGSMDSPRRLKTGEGT